MMKHRPYCFLHLQSSSVVLFIPMLLLLSSVWATGGADVVDDREFIFDGFSGGADLTMDGDASVADGLLRLTSSWQVRSKGHAFYTYPLNFASTASFSTTFVYFIVRDFGDDKIRGYKIRGHGLAFVLSSTKEYFNAYAIQFMGLFNMSTYAGNSSNHILAIELDTILNSEFNDINNNHVGIDVNSIFSNTSHEAGYYTADGEFHPLNLISEEPMQVWVDYDSNQSMLNVTIAPYRRFSAKPSRPLLSYTYDLSSIFPTTAVYAGFSSSTGLSIAIKHYVLGWSFKLNGKAAELDYKTILGLARQLQSRKHNYKTILCIVLLPILSIAILATAILAKIHIKRRLQARENELEWEREYGPPSFTYKDLLAATSGFKDTMLLGRGGFGDVYKGMLPHSKHAVAVKRVSPESKQGMKEFMAEIIILGNLRHRNLVQLLGYCRHQQQLLLVYDYMPNGSLDCYLHAQDHNTTHLCWHQRFHIIKGVAGGLFYLHDDWEQIVIHRDIKTSNVLLDGEMNARLGDFGLARSHDHGADAHTTRVGGTWGYIAPELARLGKATKATDIFAFGVLMMEVVCGRRPIWLNIDNGEPLALADWVLATWQGGSITDAVDPRLDLDDYVKEEMELVLKLGLLCSHPVPNARPRMRLVMQFLERDASLPADLQPDTFLSSDLGQDCQEEKHYQVAMSCPMTAITDLSKGR